MFYLDITKTYQGLLLILNHKSGLRSFKSKNSKKKVFKVITLKKISSVILHSKFCFSALLVTVCIHMSVRKSHEGFN